MLINVPFISDLGVVDLQLLVSCLCKVVNYDRGLKLPGGTLELASLRPLLHALWR